MFTRHTWLILVAALAAGLGLWAAQRLFAPLPAADTGLAALEFKAVRPFPQPRALPPFELHSKEGAITQDSLRGRWSLVFLGFTFCPDICPTTLAELAQAQTQWAALPEAIRPRVLFVSIDPGRDSPERAAEYAAYFHPDTLAATAQEPALEDFASSIGMVYMKVEQDGDDYTMDHSTALVLIDPQGRQAGLIRPPFVPADIARDLALLAETQP